MFAIRIVIIEKKNKVFIAWNYCEVRDKTLLMDFDAKKFYSLFYRSQTRSKKKSKPCDGIKQRKKDLSKINIITSFDCNESLELISYYIYKLLLN